MRLLPKSPWLYNLSRRYIDRWNGDNNCDPHRNGEYRLIGRVLPGARVAFDVGANVGEWTRQALGVNPRLAVHCFEPNSRTFTRLCENNFPPAVVCRNAGLSSSAGERTLYLFEQLPALDSLYQRQGLEELGLGPQQRTETVRLITLDDYCGQHRIDAIDFLKIDVEGHELDVLKGASAMLSRGGIAMAQFEYGGCNIDSGIFLKEIFSFFKDHKCSLYKILPDRLLPVERYSQRLENFQYQNWLAVHEAHAAKVRDA